MIALLEKSPTRSTHSSLWQPSFSLVLAALLTHGGFNNFQLNMMASERFSYQSYLCCWTLAAEFYCIPTDRTAFARLAFAPGHASSCTEAYGWFSLAATALGRRPIRTLTWPCLVLHDLFSVGGVRSSFSTKTLSCAIPLKKKKTDFCGPFPALGGSSEPPEPPIATPLHVKKPEGSNKLKRIAALLWLASTLE